jgi:hypothetical protein
MALTAAGVAAKLKHGKPGTHCDDHGLYLKIVKAGRGQWILRYTRQGCARTLGLGPVA